MNILVTGAWQNAMDYLDDLRQNGHEVIFLQQEKDPLPCDYQWVEGIIGNGIFLTHPIEKFENLRYIQLTSAGFDRVPMDYVEQHSIEIHNARGVYSVPMAEFALSGVLQLYKQSRCFYENQKRHTWEKRREIWELAGKTVLIVGCGSVGTECAKRFGAMDCHVLGIDLYPREDSHYETMAGLDQLDTLLPRTDVIVLTLPITEQTRHLINRSRLAILKKTAIIVNIARGGVTDEEALMKALPDLGGAVLDVFAQEPLSEDDPLWDMENVIITPHNSFIGSGNQKRLSALILENIRNK